jgi:hypothetical protein
MTQVDGELLPPGRVLEVTVDPGSLLVRVPKGESRWGELLDSHREQLTEHE